MEIKRPSYLHNGNFYTGKTTSLYWIRSLVEIQNGKHSIGTCYNVQYTVNANINRPLFWLDTHSHHNLQKLAGHCTKTLFVLWRNLDINNQNRVKRRHSARYRYIRQFYSVWPWSFSLHIIKRWKENDGWHIEYEGVIYIHIYQWRATVGKVDKT